MTTTNWPIRERNSQYYHCIFGHVHRGVVVISIGGLILSALNILSYALVRQYYSWSLSVLWICIYLALLYGNRTHRPFFYLPYLVVNTLSIFIILSLSLAMLVATPFIVSNDRMLDHVDEKDKLTFGILTGVLGLFLFCSSILSIYFNYVVYLAYRFLQDAVLDSRLEQMEDV